SIELPAQGNSNSPHLAEAPDGSIWITYGVLETEGFVREQTRVVQLSAMLDSTLAETTFNLISGREQPRGLYVDESQVIVISRGDVFSDSLGFAVRTLNMVKLSPETLEIEERIPDFFPRGGFISTGFMEFLPVGEDRIATLARVDKDSLNGADVLLIREYNKADFSFLVEYELRGIRRASISMDFAYVPELDAYATTNRSFNAILFQRNETGATVLDTIVMPDGAQSNFSRNRIVYADNSLYMLGRSSYRIDFTGAAVDSVYPIANASTNFSVQTLNADGQIVTVSGSNNENFNLPMQIIALGDSVAANDTLALISASTGTAINFYPGIPPFSPTSGGEADFLGIRFTGNLGAIGNTWGLDIVEAETGELTGDQVLTNDISFWQEFDFDPELAGLVATPSGYLGFVNERFTRISFFKYDRNFNILQPDSVGFGAIDFPDFPRLNGDRVLKYAATTYGLVGTTQGEPSDGGSYRPYVFAMDTNFVTRIMASIDTLSYYPFSPLNIAVDTADRIYTLGIQIGQNGQFSLSDTLNLIAHEADGTPRYVRQIALNAGYDFANPSIGKIMLNSDQSELLIGGIYTDSTFVRLGFYVRVNTEDGSIIEQVLLPPSNLGYQSISSHFASYDTNDNILLSFIGSKFASSGVFSYDIRTIQIDALGGSVLADEVSATIPLVFPTLNDASSIGEGIYLGGSIPSLSGIRTEAFLARVNTGTLVSTKDQKEDVTEEFEFNVFPNPAVDQVTLTWENEQAATYRLQIFDLTGRVLRQQLGEQGVGRAQVEVGLAQLPMGTYFVRLDLPQGYLLRPIVKQ
ncbi:MAG: T9SS type A sorting domain-containing protein, partial [Bacteroidota bacterium]